MVFNLHEITINWSEKESEVHMHAPGDNGKYEGESWNEAIHR